MDIEQLKVGDTVREKTRYKPNGRVMKPLWFAGHATVTKIVKGTDVEDHGVIEVDVRGKYTDHFAEYNWQEWLEIVEK